MSQIRAQVVTRDVWRCMLRQSEKQPCGLHTMSWSHRVLISLFLYSPRKAEGDTVPLLRDTMTLIPVSMKGTEKSMTSDLSSLMVREPTAMWAFFDTTCSATTERHTHGGNVKGQPAYMLLNILIIVEVETQWEANAVLLKQATLCQVFWQSGNSFIAAGQYLTSHQQASS